MAFIQKVLQNKYFFLLNSFRRSLMEKLNPIEDKYVTSQGIGMLSLKYLFQKCTSLNFDKTFLISSALGLQYAIIK